MHYYYIFAAKAARKEGGQPWPSPLQGWLATVRPHARAASHGLATRKGAADCGQGQPTREAGGASKGRQTLAAYRRPPIGAAARKGSSPQGQQPIGAVPVGRSTARKGSRQQGQRSPVAYLSRVGARGGAAMGAEPVIGATTATA
ncbi:hypothetical protein GW17_00040038 [Ensete ventricosum]|nr:hypothetical protein GW17_00040038 [Ensete ventricosum]